MTLLRKHGLWLVFATIAGIAGAWLLYIAQPIAYSATAQVDVESQAFGTTTPAPPNMETEVQIVTSGVVLTSTARALGLSPAALQPRLSGKEPSTANILSISCKMPEPAAAQRCANAAAAAYIAFRNMATSSKTDKAQDPLHATLVTVAPLPASPAGLGKKILLPVGAILGLTLGLGAILVRDHNDDRVRDRADLEQCLDAPVVAAVPLVSRGAGSPASVFCHAPHSAAAEAYRYIRARLEPLLSLPEGGVVVLVTSPRGHEGRTSVAANLAAALAHAGDNVILVDADVRRPSLDKLFHTGDRPGITDLLTGRASLEEVAVPTEVPGLRLATAGEVAGRPTEMFEVFRLNRGFARMKAVADVIVVDSAPMLAVSDALTLAHVSDIVVIVADPRRTTRGDARSVAQQIRSVGLGTIVGVLNRVPWSLRNLPVRPSLPLGHQSPTSSSDALPALAGVVPPRGTNGQGEARHVAGRVSRRGRPRAGTGVEDTSPAGQDPG